MKQDYCQYTDQEFEQLGPEYFQKERTALNLIFSLVVITTADKFLLGCVTVGSLAMLYFKIKIIQLN
jgi:hypothetical protein